MRRAPPARYVGSGSDRMLHRDGTTGLMSSQSVARGARMAETGVGGVRSPRPQQPGATGPSPVQERACLPRQRALTCLRRSPGPLCWRRRSSPAGTAIEHVVGGRSR